MERRDHGRSGHPENTILLCGDRCCFPTCYFVPATCSVCIQGPADKDSSDSWVTQHCIPAHLGDDDASDERCCRKGTRVSRRRNVGTKKPPDYAEEERNTHTSLCKQRRRTRKHQDLVELRYLPLFRRCRPRKHKAASGSIGPDCSRRGDESRHTVGDSRTLPQCPMGIL